MKKTLTLCAALVAAAWCSGVNAQSATNAMNVRMAQNPSATAATQAQQRDIDPSALAEGGLRVLALIDGSQLGELWDGASQVAKQAVARNGFIANVTQTRKTLGVPANRVWVSVRRQMATQGMPPGLYATTEFATTFEKDKPVLEVVSLRRDEDGRWRFAGYFVVP